MDGWTATEILFLEVGLVFLALGGFFSWLAWSIYRLRRSNHDIRNALTIIALAVEAEIGKPLPPLGTSNEQR